MNFELDTSWDALCDPGYATEYFDLPDPSHLKINTKSFNLSNAWWLAEITRLSYHYNFNTDQNINLGCFNYKKVVFIDNFDTSTHISLLEVNGLDEYGKDISCLVISFRGTDELEDWNTNLKAHQTPFGSKGKVHSGFKAAYLSIKDQLFEHLNSYSLPIFITGHSLGGALAILATSDIYKSDNFDSCYTFGSPRIGSPELVKSIQCERVYRVVNNCDIVTVVPLDLPFIKYRHIGSSYLLDDHGKLIPDLSEEEIYSYQKSKSNHLKQYAKTKLFNIGSKSLKTELPFFLADHAPINYVTVIKNNYMLTNEQR